MNWRDDAPAYSVCACLFMLMLFADFRATHPSIHFWPERSQPTRFVPDCEHLYDNDHTQEWWACMGVPRR